MFLERRQNQSVTDGYVGQTNDVGPRRVCVNRDSLRLPRLRDPQRCLSATGIGLRRTQWVLYGASTIRVVFRLRIDFGLGWIPTTLPERVRMRLSGEADALGGSLGTVVAILVAVIWAISVAETTSGYLL